MLRKFTESKHLLRRQTDGPDYRSGRVYLPAALLHSQTG